MRWVNVHVVDDASEPVSAESVKIVIHHGGLVPDTSLEKYTDADGLAKFVFEGGPSVDVYVNGMCQLDSVGVDEEYTVPI